MRPSDLPNLISAVRILLILPIIVLLVREQFVLALVLFVIAAVSDVVDGYLARRYGWTSWLGGWLDPVADKSMQISVYILLAWLTLIPVWLVVAVIARDLIIVAGGLVYYFRIEKVEAEPSWTSKINTAIQMLLVVVVLFDQGVYQLPDSWIDILIYVVLGSILLSGAGYVTTWSKRAWHITNAKSAKDKSTRDKGAKVKGTGDKN
ncbi:MAG: CDP-alcohol phosphatidyltransferase family protein, partial [Gammaproteobacteria bacterium]|nr:CDP-alcohol phosphatidyltransferase family protein [Gammaproteobacteria bacterium]